MENRPAYAIDSVDYALRLLLLLRRDGSIRVTDAAAELGVARSTAHRLLAMLKYRGFVVQDRQRLYRAGPAFGDFGVTSLSNALPAIARPHMQRLTYQIGETTNLLVLSGTSVRFLESVEGTQVLRVGSRLGVVLPAERTSGGKALLAELPRAELDELYAGRDDLPLLLRQLSVVRRRGYGANFEESEGGVTAIGLNVRDAEATAIAAVTISAPTVRYKRGAIVELLPQLRACAELIRREITG